MLQGDREEGKKVEPERWGRDRLTGYILSRWGREPPHLSELTECHHAASQSLGQCSGAPGLGKRQLLGWKESESVGHNKQA